MQPHLYQDQFVASQHQDHPQLDQLGSLPTLDVQFLPPQLLSYPYHNQVGQIVHHHHLLCNQPFMMEIIDTIICGLSSTSTPAPPELDGSLVLIDAIADVNGDPTDAQKSSLNC